MNFFSTFFFNCNNNKNMTHKKYLLIIQFILCVCLCDLYDFQLNENSFFIVAYFNDETVADSNSKEIKRRICFCISSIRHTLWKFMEIYVHTFLCMYSWKTKAKKKKKKSFELDSLLCIVTVNSERYRDKNIDSRYGKESIQTKENKNPNSRKKSWWTVRFQGKNLWYMDIEFNQLKSCFEFLSLFFGSFIENSFKKTYY